LYHSGLHGRQISITSLLYPVVLAVVSAGIGCHLNLVEVLTTKAVARNETQHITEMVERTCGFRSTSMSNCVGESPFPGHSFMKLCKEPKT
jgi:hypothetical protein